MMDLGSVKKDFGNLLQQVQPWTLSHFVMWLDIKVAEYKVFGRMIMDNTPNDTPQWLRASADYLEQQQKEAQAQAAAAQGDKDLSPTVPTVPPPTLLSPRSSHTIANLHAPLQQITSTYEPVTSFATSTTALYTVSTVNTTVVSPSVSPAFSTTSQTKHTQAVEAFPKPSVPISTPDPQYNKTSAAQYAGVFPQRIPPISHLSPKHIRQSHIDQGLSMSLPVALAGKESLTTAEVESQIAVLESQIAAVNRSLKQSAQVTGLVETATPSSSTTNKSGRRKADTTTDDATALVPPPYPKKIRQQSPVRSTPATTTAVEATPLPPLHSSMDMLARMHRLDTESIPESLRSQNIQSTLEAFEALRTQTFPPNTDALRAQMSQMTAEVESMQNTAQDMSLHHMPQPDREQLPQAYINPPEEQELTYTMDDREQTYTPTSDTTSAAYTMQQSEIRVKVEAAGHSDEDSTGMADMNALKVMTPEVGSHTEVGTNSDMMHDDGTYPVGLYVAAGNNAQANTDDKLAAELTTKKMRRKFLESMKNSNPKYYSHQIQQIIPFPDKFPVANLDYGLKALQMIQTGEITRAGKIQLIDTIFHELIKYTGLYPTPTQKMAVANAIVETFPTLAAKMKASHISPADSWYVILCDKFRNERRGLGGVGASPRMGKVKKEHQDPHMPMSVDPMDEHEASMEQECQPEIVTEDVSSHTPITQVDTLNQASTTQYTEAAVHTAFQHGYNTTQVAVPDMTSEDDEDEVSTSALTDVEKLPLNTDESRLYTEKTKRSVRRKTHSPKRVQKPTPEMSMLDERYAASLLEYYSKHKPYYPASDTETNKHIEEDEEAKASSNEAMSSEALVQAAASQVAVSQAIAQAVASHAVGNTDEPYSAEVAAIVQTVVSAHMDEVLAARNYQGNELGLDAHYPAPAGTPAPEVEGTVEVKTSSKKKAKIIQKERTPEQQQVTLQRFKQKLAVTYPGVQAVDDSTLLCTCGAKVKLGRARMLHNYSNYHLKRCQNPPITARHELHSPSGSAPLALHNIYPGQGSPGELNIPTSGPKVIAKEMESAAFVGLSAADRETIQKHFLLNVPVPTSDNTIVAGSTSSTPTQSLDLSMPVTGHNILNIPVSSTAASDLTMSVNQGHHQNGSSASTPDISQQHETSELRSTHEVNPSVLNVPLPGQGQTASLGSVHGVSDGQSKVVVVSADSGMCGGSAESLDLTMQSSGPSVLIEQQPGSDLRVQIPGSIATSIAEFSGELPDLSAINALALIQGKTDQPMETSDTNEQGSVSNEEPINLANT